MLMRHIVICGLSGSPYFSTLPHKTTRFSITEYKTCVLIFPTTFVWNISNSKKNLERYNKKKSILVFMKITRSFPILMKLEFHRHVFQKYSNIKCHEYPSNGNRRVPCVHTDGRRDMTNLTADFRNVANAPKLVACTVTQWAMHYEMWCSKTLTTRSTNMWLLELQYVAVCESLMSNMKLVIIPFSTYGSYKVPHRPTAGFKSLGLGFCLYFGLFTLPIWENMAAKVRA